MKERSIFWEDNISGQSPGNSVWEKPTLPYLRKKKSTMPVLSTKEVLQQKAILLQKIRHFFSDKPVRKVWLFGSFARGDFNTSSDVDILVAWDYSKMTIGWEYFGWWSDLEAVTGRKVDLVSEGYLSKYVQPFVFKSLIGQLPNPS